jgi:phosphohistidine phosphatase SixA
MNIRMSLGGFALAVAGALALSATGANRALASQDSQPASGETEVDLRPATVIAIRHAEKGDNDPRDPRLSEAGEARAQTLSEMLLYSGVTHIFSTDYQRTQMTVATLAAATGVAIETYNPRDLQALADILHALPAGSVAVVSGHSNTTPSIVAALGGEAKNLTSYRDMDVLGEHEYNRMFLVTLPHAKSKAPVTTLELRYGAGTH